MSTAWREPSEGERALMASLGYRLWGGLDILFWKDIGRNRSAYVPRDGSAVAYRSHSYHGAMSIFWERVRVPKAIGRELGAIPWIRVDNDLGSSPDSWAIRDEQGLMRRRPRRRERRIWETGMAAT